jgi:WYL domain-containing protein
MGDDACASAFDSAPLEAFWNELPAFFVWLEGGAAPVVFAAYAVATGETVLRDRTMRLPLSGGAQSFLEVIRFAANRLYVELDYQGSTRRIEPYSLRRTSNGNIVLHAFNADKGEHRSYRVDRIRGARTTNQAFVPRYEIELTPEGPVHIKPASARSSSGSFGGFSVSPSRSPRSSRRSGSNGPTYLYECSHCGKRFNRKKRTSQLNPHKDKHGYPCAGRYGLYVDTR